MSVLLARMAICTGQASAIMHRMMAASGAASAATMTAISAPAAGQLPTIRKRSVRNARHICGKIGRVCSWI